MIINIPLNIPDEMLENTIAKDYEAKITERLTKEVRDAICKHDIYGDKGRGLSNWVGSRIDDILKEYTDIDDDSPIYDLLPTGDMVLRKE